MSICPKICNRSKQFPEDRIYIRRGHRGWHPQSSDSSQKLIPRPSNLCLGSHGRTRIRDREATGFRSHCIGIPCPLSHSRWCSVRTWLFSSPPLNHKYTWHLNTWVNWCPASEPLKRLDCCHRDSTWSTMVVMFGRRWKSTMSNRRTFDSFSGHCLTRSYHSVHCLHRYYSWKVDQIQTGRKFQDLHSKLHFDKCTCHRRE